MSTRVKAEPYPRKTDVKMHHNLGLSSFLVAVYRAATVFKSIFVNFNSLRASQINLALQLLISWHV